MQTNPSRLAELLGTEQAVVVVTESGVEFPADDLSLPELWELAFALALVDALPETEERSGV